MRRTHAVLCLLALTLTACGSTAPTPSPTPATPVVGAEGGRDVILATTTSTQDSGLLDVLIPRFEQRTGYRVKPVAVGTGQALKMGQMGEADVLLVHAPKAEEAYMQSGAGVDRRLVMHNDFVIVGPDADPAAIKGLHDTEEALEKIASSDSPFVSRGDDSGTHKKERELWAKAGIEPGGGWYIESGTGMGQTLRIASEKGGYTLADRGTYLALRDGLDLRVLVEKLPPLLNIYHVIGVNPEQFPKVNAAGGKAFADFLVSPEAQRIIGEFGREKYGQPLFVPDAGKSEEELGSNSGERRRVKVALRTQDGARKISGRGDMRLMDEQDASAQAHQDGRRPAGAHRRARDLHQAHRRGRHAVRRGPDPTRGRPGGDRPSLQAHARGPRGVLLAGRVGRRTG